MKVYVVSGWIAYEGQDDPSGVFLTLDEAIMFTDKLLDDKNLWNDGYNIYEIEVGGGTVTEAFRVKRERHDP